MYKNYVPQIAKDAVPIYLVPANFDFTKKTEPYIQKAVNSQKFEAKPHQTCLVYDAKGSMHKVLAPISDPPSIWDLAHLPQKLPKGDYYLKDNFLNGILEPDALKKLILGWGMGYYRYSLKEKTQKPLTPNLLLGKSHDKADFENDIKSIFYGRDLINMPANLLGPERFEKELKNFAKKHYAKCSVIKGKTLEKNFPLIHGVGKAAEESPRFVEIHWGKKSDPLITLVGKGVCFDTGGLDLKGANYMKLMKKDMGGAAQIIALASMIMQAKLPLRLRLLIPIVENAIGSRAYRPQDVLYSRKGLSIEIDNTDAEGRLVLADALNYAASEKSEIIIDFATLTGAARVALGLDLPALFSNDKELAFKLSTISEEIEDPVWPLPLWQGYKDMLKSQIADIRNSAESPYAGAITAALFLEYFIPEETTWLHIDLMAWNIHNRPGRPIGGEIAAVRTLFHYLKKTYC